METSKNERRPIFRSKAALLIGLVVLVVAGSIVFFLSPAFKSITARSHPTVSIPASSNTTMFGYDLQRTHFNPSEHILGTASVSHLVSYWTASTGSYILSSPTVANGIVYVGSSDELLYALDAKTGKRLWLHVAKDDVGSSAAIANGIVFAGSEDRNVYAFDARTGKPIWTASTGATIHSSPAVANGVVYVGSQDHKLYAFDAHTGAMLWSYTTGDVVDSSPAVVNGVVYVGSWDGKVYAFHL
jgi:outer membrane protein assembly factor BamB